MDENKQPSAELEINQAEEIVIHSIAETMDLYGITSSIGRLYAIMYFKQHPMTLDEMKDEVGMSKPSMSTAVRQLQEINIVKKIWQKGSRKDHFVAEKNFFNYFSQFFGTKWKREAELNLFAIEQAEHRLQAVMEDEKNEESLKERAEQDLQQLDGYRKYCYWLQKLVNSMESGEIFDLLPMDNSNSKK
ncbi:DNA-binding transcriptional regulator GbsR (MarR family) [Scopulibacillus darangshiensis]|uniref:HTH-type transcriptional regulator n=1 Tax=Scopulibacillus darangshiensis TaxID=442528 RepID=A0A4R2NSK0_9BACL|nr:GbsR/MarR family transcriptional regulator [Scopulibacillus darangshiensis]TCP24939.1 DNA-binding transcriptional regulator GbsR (MarR family) [Scopulibacillus darangshiensis]